MADEQHHLTLHRYTVHKEAGWLGLTATELEPDRKEAAELHAPVGMGFFQIAIDQQCTWAQGGVNEQRRSPHSLSSK